MLQKSTYFLKINNIFFTKYFFNKSYFISFYIDIYNNDIKKYI